MKDVIHLDNIGDEIASRRLILQGDGTNKEVIVRIGKPQQFPDYSGYFCPFEISGIDDRRLGYAAGVDAIQALQLVMVMIGAKLEYLRKTAPGRLIWEGDPTGGLGFPDKV